MRTDVFVAVWGEHFVGKFLDISVPSQLSQGNLPALGKAGDVAYTIYTDRASAPLFAAGAGALAAAAEVTYRYFEDIEFRGGTLAEAIANSDPRTVKHNVQRVCARDHLGRAAAAKAAALLLDSDFVLVDGTLARAVELRAEGKRAVTTMFMRLSEEGAASALRERLAGIAPGAAGLTGRELVALGLDHPHPIADSFYLDGARFTPYPSQINWRVGAHGFVAHCLFPHPLMVVPDADAVHYFSTMDYEYALRAVADDSEIHLAQSSDEMLVCKVTPDGYLADLDFGPPPGIDDLARFVVNNTNIRHRYFFQRPIRFAAGGDEAAWAAAEAESQRFVEAVYKAAELMIAELPHDDPKTLLFLKSFLGPIENFMSPQVQSRMKAWMPGSK